MPRYPLPCAADYLPAAIRSLSQQTTDVNKKPVFDWNLKYQCQMLSNRLFYLKKFEKEFYKKQLLYSRPMMKN
jgi:hypothetical protein